MAHQNVFFSDDLIRSGQTVRIGDYRLPGQLSPVFKCCGDSSHSESLPYSIVDHSCSTDDYISISGEHSSGIVSFRHRYVTNDGMNPFRFNHLYSELFEGWSHYMGGNEVDRCIFIILSQTKKGLQLPHKAYLRTRNPY